jgi:hypothetical protein
VRLRDPVAVGQPGRWPKRLICDSGHNRRARASGRLFAHRCDPPHAVASVADKRSVWVGDRCNPVRSVVANLDKSDSE